MLQSKGNELDGVKGNPVSGEFAVSDILRRILENTGWTFYFNTADEVSIERERPKVIHHPPPISLAPSRPTGSVGTLSDTTEPPPGSLVATALPEVRVTGTLFRTVDTIISPVVTLAAGQIEDSGYEGVQSAVNATLPLASNNTPRPDYSPVAGNFGGGQGINLRDLGVHATLVLVNDLRQPLAGMNSDFVDVAAIPDAAIDRIEVIPTGASALYGSDAIAGVVNVRLRRALDGAESSLRYTQGEGGGNETVASQAYGGQWDGGHALIVYQYTDRTSVPFASRSYAASANKTAEGGNDFRSIFSNPGNILNPQTALPAFAIPNGQNGQSLTVSELAPGRVNLANQLLGVDLYPQSTSHSVYIAGEQQFSSTLSVFSDARFDMRENRQTIQAATQALVVPASNPFFIDPFGHSRYVVVAYSFVDDLGNAHPISTTVTGMGTIGVKVELPRDWQSTVTLSDGWERLNYKLYNWYNPIELSDALADPNPETAFDPFGSGSNTSRSTLDKIRAVENEDALSRVSQLRAVADGSLYASDTFSAKLAVGVDLRQEYLGQSESLTNDYNFTDNFKREIGAVFSEVAFSLPAHINLSAAGRAEYYSKIGWTENPMFGLNWAPWDSVKFRVSWGSAFRAPELPQLDTSRNVAALAVLPDPRSQSGESVVLYQEGNSPSLREEKAETWMFGLDFAPQNLAGLKASATYYSIDYSDKIAQPGPANISQILEDEADWSEVIQRNPSPAAVTAICNSPQFQGSPSNCVSTPPAVILDIRVRNLSRTIDRGIDLSLEQTLDTRLGSFHWSALGAYILAFDQAVTGTAPLTSVANTVANPIKLKARATLGWTQHAAESEGLFFKAAFNLQGGYMDNVSVPNRRIGSYSTIDTRIGYKTAAGNGIFENVEITLNATNLTNKPPPFVNNEYGFDQANDPPRSFLIAVGVKKSF